MGAKRVPSGHQVPPAWRTGRFIPLQTYTTTKPQDSIHLTCLLDIWSYMSKWLQASFEVPGEECSFKPMHLINLSCAKAELSCSLMVLVSYYVFHKFRHMVEIRKMNLIQASLISWQLGCWSQLLWVTISSGEQMGISLHGEENIQLKNPASA